MLIIKEHPGINKSFVIKVLGISRQNFYYKPQLPPKDLALKKDMESVMQEHKAYGHRRIALALKINHKRVKRVMSLFNLKPVRAIRVPKKPGDIGKLPVNIPNLLLSTPAIKPDQIWVSDFTYLPYFGRFFYLATILDAYTREILSWNLSSSHNTSFIIQALHIALAKRKAPEIFHSDQGSEYKSKKLTDILTDNKIKVSMSHKASPWQNGKQESFYGKFKLELGHPECYPTIGELTEAIALQVHYYNNRRIHTALKCQPSSFYQQEVAMR